MIVGGRVIHGTGRKGSKPASQKTKMKGTRFYDFTGEILRSVREFHPWQGAFPVTITLSFLCRALYDSFLITVSFPIPFLWSSRFLSLSITVPLRSLSAVYLWAFLFDVPSGSFPVSRFLLKIITV